MVKVTSLLKLEHMEKAYNHSLSDETWNRGWLSKHFKECLQSVIFKSVLKLNSQLGLHTTVTLTCVLVQRHWSPLTASMKTAQETHHCLHHKEAPQGGKESHLVCTPSILYFFLNNWFVKHSPDQVSLLENSSQIVTHPFSVWSRGGVQGHCVVQVRGAGGWMWSEGLLCEWHSRTVHAGRLGLLVCTFYFWLRRVLIEAWGIFSLWHVSS